MVALVWLLSPPPSKIEECEFIYSIVRPKWVSIGGIFAYLGLKRYLGDSGLSLIHVEEGLFNKSEKSGNQIGRKGFNFCV